jgi:threonine/homoserine/homoserine lactone efflux protein
VNEAIFTTIAITGFTVAFFHAAIPTHWLPFVLTARAQHWNHAKALAITALAGSGHVLFTAVLGLLLTLFGFALHEKIGNWFPRIAGGALVLFGLFYLYRQTIGHVHGHRRAFGENPQVHAAHHPPDDGENPKQIPPLHMTPPSPVSDRIAITSLLALLTFSPCESFVPFYVYGIRYGWMGFALLTAILSVATVAGMIVFTWLTLAGMRRINLRLLEKYELGLMGTLLCAVGVLIILFEK